MENAWQDFPFQQVTQLHSLLTITARLFAWGAGAMLLTTTLPAQFQAGQLFVAAATAGTTRVPEPWVAEYALIAPSLDTRNFAQKGMHVGNQLPIGFTIPLVPSPPDSCSRESFSRWLAQSSLNRTLTTTKTRNYFYAISMTLCIYFRKLHRCSWLPLISRRPHYLVRKDL